LKKSWVIELSSGARSWQKSSCALGAEVGSNNLYDTFDQAAMETAGQAWARHLIPDGEKESV
jgi:hypothetical protein